jgi:hypothetical protein
MSFFNRGSNRGGNKGRRGRGPNTFWQPGGHKKLRFSIHFDVDSDEFQQLIQTGHLNLGGQHALPQPQAAPNVILQPHLVLLTFLSPLCNLILMDGVIYLPILLLVPINGLLPPLLHQFILLFLVHLFLYLQFTQYYLFTCCYT